MSTSKITEGQQETAIYTHKFVISSSSSPSAFFNDELNNKHFKVD